MALQCHDDFCDGEQINSNLIDEINEIFDDLMCLSYTQSFKKLILIRYNICCAPYVVIVDYLCCVDIW